MFISKRAIWVAAGMAAGAACAAALAWPARGRNRGQAAGSDGGSSRIDEASEDSFPASDPPSFSAPSGAQTYPGARG